MIPTQPSPEDTLPQTPEVPVENLPKLFLMASILAFILAIVTVFTGPLFASLPAEAFSRACSNLALLAIGFALAWKPATK